MFIFQTLFPMSRRKRNKFFGKEEDVHRWNKRIVNFQKLVTIFANNLFGIFQGWAELHNSTGFDITTIQFYNELFQIHTFSVELLFPVTFKVIITLEFTLEFSLYVKSTFLIEFRRSPRRWVFVVIPALLQVVINLQLC